MSMDSIYPRLYPERPLPFRDWVNHLSHLQHSAFMSSFHRFFLCTTNRPDVHNTTSFPINYYAEFHEFWSDILWEVSHKHPWFEIDQWFFMNPITEYDFDSECEGLYTCSFIWCDFFERVIPLMRDDNFSFLAIDPEPIREHLNSMLGYVAHVRRMNQVLQELIRSKMKLFDLARLAVSIFEPELPTFLGYRESEYVSAIRNHLMDYDVAGFWEELLGPLTLDVYGPGY